MINMYRLMMALAMVVLVTFAANAQPGNGGGGFDDEPEDLSIDGGIILLVAAGATYGYKKLKAKK